MGNSRAVYRRRRTWFGVTASRLVVGSIGLYGISLETASLNKATPQFFAKIECACNCPPLFFTGGRSNRGRIE